MRPLFKKILMAVIMLSLLGIEPTFLSGCSLKSCDKTATTTAPYPYSTIPAGRSVNINVWYLFEDHALMDSLASDYQRQHPNVTITPTGFPDRATYLTALNDKYGGAGQPDVFILLNDWLGNWKQRINYMPVNYITANKDNLTGGFDPVSDTSHTSKEMDEYLARFFPALRTEWTTEVSGKNAQGISKVLGPALWGIPWASEGMSLFVNLNHFQDYNSANPTDRLTPPALDKPMTWNEFARDAQHLVYTSEGWHKVSTTGVNTVDPATVIHYGAAMGYGSYGDATTVDNAQDILTTMFLQNGINVVNPDKQTSDLTDPKKTLVAYDVLTKYAQYAPMWADNNDPIWASMGGKPPSSMAAFAAGKVSMAFGRSYQVSSIPGSLHFEVVPFPQLSDDTKTWATPSYYWAHVVNRNSQFPGIAWDFIKYVASRSVMTTYSTTYKVPPARPDVAAVIAAQAQPGLDATMQQFSLGLPYSKSYYKGGWEQANIIINTMINNVAFGKTDGNTALTTAAAALTNELKAAP